MTWEQLRELQQTGFFEIQSHSYWHPNFRKEKTRLPPLEYERFVLLQLTRSRDKIQQELGATVDILAWPFGIYDAELIGLGRKAGYVAAFTLEGRATGPSDDIMTLPRYLMTNAYAGKTFERLLRDSATSSAGF